MYNHILYLAFWVTNSTVLFLSRFVIPDNNIVLGSWRFNSFETSIYAGFWLTVLFWIWWDFAIARGIKSDNKFVNFAVFLLVNSFSAWVVSIFHHIIGFQLMHYYWALAIGFAATILQSIAWKVIVKRKSFFDT